MYVLRVDYVVQLDYIVFYQLTSFIMTDLLKKIQSMKSLNIGHKK